jgi:hypothetical protein
VLGRKYIWLYLGLLALASRVVFEIFPSLADTIYRGFVFQGIRWIWDYTIALLPFPIITALVLFGTLWLIRKWRRGKRIWQWSAFLRQLLNTVGFLFFWFMTLWGFNYQASGLTEAVEDASLTSDDLIELLDYCTSNLETDLVNIDTGYMSQPIVDWEDEIRADLVTALRTRNWPIAGKVRCRVVSNSGWMRRMGIAGIYLPFSSEGHIDNSFLFSTKAFSMAHEMSHGYGVADEGEANYAALIALVNSSHTELRISANLELLRDVLIEMRSVDIDLYRVRRAVLPADVKRMLDDMNENNSLFPPFFPALSTFSNDMYLKFQGVESGVESYNEYLYLAYQFLIKE